MPHFNTEDVYSYVVLTATMDGSAYPDAEKAVDRAIAEMKREVSAELRADTRAIRGPAIEALRRQWSGADEEISPVILHNPTGEPVVTLRLEPMDGSDGTVFMVLSDAGRILAIEEERDYYDNWDVDTEISISVPRGEADRLLKSWKTYKGRAANPRFEMTDSLRASIGAAIGGGIGALGGPWTAVVWAAVGSLVGSNWDKVTAGLKAGTEAYKATPARAPARSRRDNPGPTSAALLVGRLKF